MSVNIFVVTYRVTNLLTKLMDMLLFSREKKLFKCFSGFDMKTPVSKEKCFEIGRCNCGHELGLKTALQKGIFVVSECGDWLRGHSPSNTIQSC